MTPHGTCIYRRSPAGLSENSPGPQSLCENLLEKTMGAPGLAFETWDPPRILTARVLTDIPSWLSEESGIST